MFFYQAEGQPFDDPKEAYRVQYFYLVLDQVILSLQSRFEPLKNYVELFGFLRKKLLEYILVYTVRIYINNCRQYCFDLLGLISAVKLNLVANLLLVVFKPQ